jgi:DNA end-binding protein Ku
MPRGLWKGAISFGLVNVPVELFSAEKRSAGLDLAMLDKRDMAPVGYRRYNKATGKDVPWKEVVKGYEYADDKYVVLSDEDFRRANVEASRTIDILAFVEREQIAPLFFETPYYLAPAKRGEKPYALLRETLKKTGKAGIASVVIRTRQHLAALIAQDEVLILNTLRFTDELRDLKDFDFPAAVKKQKLSAKEMELAMRLVDDMAGKWQPDRYKDTYRRDLLARIKEKVKAGKTEELTAPQKEREGKGEVIDLMAALKKSVARNKHAEKPKHRRRAA